MSNIQRIELLDALCERDLADLDLDGLMAKINERIPPDRLSGMLLEIVRDAVRLIGPVAFRAGYYQGARVGMDIAMEIAREGNR